MVVNKFPQIVEWLLGANGFTSGALWIFILLVFVAGFLGLFFGFLVASLRHGPAEAFYSVAKVVGGSPPDWLRISPRRVTAIARLAAKEAVRRRVILVAFIIFALSLLFGGWFISGAENAERVYINFVMWGTQLLILMMVMLISSFSLPEDIKNRTIYTVATKPVRTSEIVIGRIFGFAALGTGLLLLMGVISLLFVWRGLSHDHVMAVDDNNKVEFGKVDRKSTGHRASESAVLESRTAPQAGHFHYVEIVEDIRDKTAPPPVNMKSVISQEERDGKIVYRRLEVRHAGGHTHTIDYDNENYKLSGSKGFFRARVPLYAESLLFYDREGNKKARGLSVGEQWGYRGYVSGGVTLSRAEYIFDGFTPEKFDEADKLPMELTLSVFRSNQGDIYTRIRVGLQFESVNAEGEDRFVSEMVVFETQEFDVQVKAIPRVMPGQKFSPNGTLLENGNFDIFDDYAGNGKVRLIVRCVDQDQYLGMARADIYFRAADRPYWINFTRGYIGIWLQMMIVISLGVAFSTFLSAPVTMLATICAIVFGFFSSSITKFASFGVDGGGPIESFIRLITQKNLNTPFPDSLGTTIMQKLDGLFLSMVGAITNLVPNFSDLDFSDFLTYGYFVSNDRILVAAAVTAAFCTGMAVLGYFCLKTRELAG